MHKLLVLFATYFCFSTATTAAFEATTPFCGLQDWSDFFKHAADQQVIEATDYTSRDTFSRMVSCVLNRSVFTLLSDLTFTGLVRKLDPLYFKDMDYNVTDAEAGIDVNGTLQQFYIDSFSDLFVRNFVFDLHKQKVDLIVEFQRVFVSTNYNVTGNMSGMSNLLSTSGVFGSGHLEANLTNLYVNFSFAYSLPSLMLQVVGFNYDYDVGNLHVLLFPKYPSEKRQNFVNSKNGKISGSTIKLPDGIITLSGLFNDAKISTLVTSIANDVGTKLANTNKQLVKKVINQQISKILGKLLVDIAHQSNSSKIQDTEQPKSW